MRDRHALAAGAPTVIAGGHDRMIRALRDLDEADGVPDRLVRVEGCRVAWSDPRAIAADFGIEAVSDRDRLDRWLLDQCGWISEAQLANQDANRPIPVGQECRTGFRPPHYGRATILEATCKPGENRTEQAPASLGLLDVKGCGIAPGKAPQAAFHATGLLPLREALRELASQLVIDRIFRAHGLEIRGVPVYAVLQLGFAGVTPGTAGRGAEPVALLVRRAHSRPPGNVELPRFGSEAHRAKLLVEFVLRRHGITSANPRARLEITRHGTGEYSLVLNGAEADIRQSRIRQLLATITDRDSASCDIVNVQTTRHADYAGADIELVDFGHYFLGADRFDRPLISLVDDVPLNFGGIFHPDDDGFPQPIEGLALPAPLFGPRDVDPDLYSWTGHEPPAREVGLTLLVLRLARDFTQEKIGRTDLEEALSAFAEQATRHLSGDRI